ncbi:sulfatase-like hydrolase/transferase [Flammeovirga yaeyamensis]|uniref:Sulfatase-like hydrolase/transferase n=1 Tax=Flammeovirga yaeyamensis TaxID=367791 RepID=A0AAX1NCU5_9BACT|nr:arylsulfatase [Flammeovirga yaeyamensis]MBB3697029.1 arylsulfatase A-like enzyme [Flammeovirga yaeyamensis]NMF33692.1 arylsulfatase [Flammeovirga yaeyamensis]QWG05042.1 sulfatase-like hydrolase/transferase [Flammeovirga yaeyamensis]
MNKLLKLLLISTGLFTSFSCSENKKVKPNIVIIYADDMGYGDLNIQNPNSKIPTPNLDRLATEGMRFTDAHSSSGICSPSRFALLTGSYHWRRQHDIINSFGAPFFKDSDITLPQVLKTQGYKTACIGKWHLGWDWEFENEPSGEAMLWGKMKKMYLNKDFDWSKPIKGGPTDRGFDYYFGDGTINFPPYAWIENDRILEAPSEDMDMDSVGFDTKEGRWEFRLGPKVKDWNPYEVLPTLTNRTVDWLQNQKKDQPFFLYFALPSPHAPIIPNDEFDGKSKAGGYGDYMFQTDWVVGQVMKTLKEKGLEDNTIIIFSADNGTEAYAYERAVEYDHFSMGNFRGVKRDVWEGGHHVPFIIKWPGNIKPNSVSNEVISQVDVMATLANITGAELTEKAAPDSYDFTPVITDQKYNTPLREATIHNTYKSIWGIRKGDWVFINKSTGGHKKVPKAFDEITNYPNFKTKGLLFNMVEDPEQRVNLYEKYPDKIVEMDSLLHLYRTSNSSTEHLK